MKIEPGMAAVVTGGASRLGKASAKAFADASMKVAFFDINDEAGKAHARAIGGTFHHAEMMGEARVVPGFAAARAATGQERVTLHCAMASRRGKTIGCGWDKQSCCSRCRATEDFTLWGARHPHCQLLRASRPSA